MERNEQKKLKTPGFTPGPWDSRFDPIDEMIHFFSHATGKRTFTVTNNITSADEALLAAAPDLYAACEAQDRLIRYYGILLSNYRVGTRPSEKTLDEVDKADRVIDAARAALAKAGGGE